MLLFDLYVTKPKKILSSLVVNSVMKPRLSFRVGNRGNVGSFIWTRNQIDRNGFRIFYLRISVKVGHYNSTKLKVANFHRLFRRKLTFARSLLSLS